MSSSTIGPVVRIGRPRVPRRVLVSRLLVTLTLWTAGAALLALLPAPCMADVAPESGLFMHVWGDTIPTDCHEIVRTTSAEGSVTFLLFFMRGIWSWPGETLCIRSLQTQVSWPETWQLVHFEPSGGGYGSLDPSGPNYALTIDWAYANYSISDEPQGIIEVARFVMNVEGPGKLDLPWIPYEESTVDLTRDCYGTTFTTYPAQAFAEAGISCGYVSARCGSWEGDCQADFEVPDLRLSAPPGVAADSTVVFWASWGATDRPCPLEVDTHASWCTAWIDPKYNDVQWEEYLHVVADAAGLEPGVYETQIELYNTRVARCLPVVFTVGEEPIAISPTTWGRIKAQYRSPTERSDR